MTRFAMQVRRQDIDCAYDVPVKHATASRACVDASAGLFPLPTHIARQTGQTFSIVSEIIDVRNRDLAEVTSADDVIISERLVALALAQIAENKAVVPVFVEFLNPGGVEIYLKPAQDYIAIGKPVTFYTVLEAARRKGQTAIGYRLLAEASTPERAFGVHLNPEKSIPVTFSEHDRIIVLAED